MKFRVHGADKLTGKERTFDIDCSSADEASERANAEGFLVSGVEPADGAKPIPATPLDYAATAPPKPVNVGAIVLNVVCAIIFAGGPIVLGGAMMYNFAGTPCIGDLLVIFGLMFVIAGFGVLGVITGVIKPGDLPQTRPAKHYNSAMICPHCQSKGTVHTEKVKLKKGVSGTKATAAVFTGGLSMLATGLSRKEEMTKAHCSNCGNTWHF